MVSILRGCEAARIRPMIAGLRQVQIIRVYPALATLYSEAHRFQCQVYEPMSAANDYIQKVSEKHTLAWQRKAAAAAAINLELLK